MVDPLTDPLLTLVFRLLVAFGIGALIGLEREQSESGGSFAGSRTFPLFGLYGALVQAFFPAMLPIALAVLALPLSLAYVGKVWLERDIGLTTLTAALLTVLFGALAAHSLRGTIVAIVAGGATMALLSAKGPIHRLAGQIGESERRATVKFVLVALVVLPVLPDRELAALYGLNPRFVWLMVVFVTGLSFSAYVLSRTIGARRGIALTGILGGFVSSTATAVSMAERTIQTPDLYRICAFSTVIAAVVMFPRAMIEVAVVNPSLLPHVVVPLGAMTAVGFLAAGVLYWWTPASTTVSTDIANPVRLRPAVFFGGLFAIVVVVSRYADEMFGATGVYATAFVSGLADVDAITLTLSKLAADGTVAPDVATTGIVIAAITNTLVKAALAWVIGTPQLGRLVTGMLGVIGFIGVLIVVI